MKKIETAVDAADPDISFFIDQQASDQVAGQGGRVFFEMPVLSEGLFFVIKNDQAVFCGSQQEVAQAVFLNDTDDIVAGLLDQNRRHAGRI